jgi:phenylacetate-CoA ligase
MRENIENTFGCDIYDGYGLNDGGVGAYECSEHSGLHIDMERSIMEIVDKKGHQMEDGVGSILATSLYNYAMPFIRYETGDLGHIIPTNCGCGRGSRLLKEKLAERGRPCNTRGKSIHGCFFCISFGNMVKG